MSKLNSAAPTFPVADVDVTIRWYETELGFTSYPFPENPPHVFASVSRDDVEIMFQRIDGYQKPDLCQRRSGGVSDAYIGMEGVKEIFETSMVKTGNSITLPKHSYSDCKIDIK